MADLVEKDEPEIVQSVVAESEPDYRMPIIGKEDRAVKVSAFQMRNGNERDPNFCK